MLPPNADVWLVPKPPNAGVVVVVAPNPENPLAGALLDVGSCPNPLKAGGAELAGVENKLD